MTTNLQFQYFNDFTGGLNVHTPSSELKPNETPDCDNVQVHEKGFYKRAGDTAFCTAMNSGKNVQGLGFCTIGGTDYLISICGDKIYKSDALDGTMDDITGTVTIGDNQNYIWQQLNLNNLSVWVGGAPNAPIKWSGTGNAAALGGTPSTGNFGFVTHDRAFIGNTAAAPSTLYWSVLSNIEDWTNTGSGNQTVETNDLDTLIAGVPINNDVTLLFKKYSIHYLSTTAAPFPVKPFVKGIGCCGKNAAINVRGLVYFMSNEPRIYFTDGYTFTKLPHLVEDIFDTINPARLPYVQAVYNPVDNQILWLVSTGSNTTNNYCIVWDLQHELWLRHTTGFRANVGCVAQGNRVFMGHYNGVIYEKLKSGKYADDSETAGVYAAPINSYWTTPWINRGNNLSVKQNRYMDISYKTQTSGVVKYSYGYNYSMNKNGQFSQIQSGGKWGSDTWNGTMKWGGQTDAHSNTFMYGRGNTYQIKIYNDNINEKMQINSISVSGKEQGIKEFSAK